MRERMAVSNMNGRRTAVRAMAWIRGATPKRRAARRVAAAICVLLALAGAGAVHAAPGTGAPDPRGLIGRQMEQTLPDVDLVGTQPLILVIDHEAELDPARGILKPGAARTHVQRVHVRAFGGEMVLTGDIRSSGTQAESVRTSLTLHRIVVEDVMHFLEMDVAGDVSGRISGIIFVEQIAGRFEQVLVTLEDDPGTMEIDRRLFEGVLVPLLSQVENEQFDAVEAFRNKMDREYGDIRRIPFTTGAFTGGFQGRNFIVRIPIENSVVPVNINLDVDPESLYEWWGRLNDLVPLEQIESIDLWPGFGD